MSRNIDRLKKGVSIILEEIGEDITRPGLVDTPLRVAKMFLELTEGNVGLIPNITMFDSENTDQMIIISNLEYTSLCEHHMAPFSGRVHIGYLPGEKIVGLSKFGRIVEFYSKRLQIQERLTSQIADFCFEVISPRGIIVMVEGRHSCMSMRGIKKANHVTYTTAIRGEVSRDEFFQTLENVNNSF